VYYYLRRWQREGVWDRVHHALVMADRERAGREASRPPASSTANRSRRSIKSGSKGYDAGKKINGRKRHILTDTDGRLLTVKVHSAGIQDRDGGKTVLKASRARYPSWQLGLARRLLAYIAGQSRSLCGDEFWANSW